MKYLLLFILNIFLITPILSEELKVAILDYDLRDKKSMTIAKYIQLKLENSSLNITQIDQYTAKNSLSKASEVLSDIESSNYNLLITITSDIVIPAMHKIKKTPWLFTNINNPKLFGIKDINNPGENRSGVTYHIDENRQISFFNRVLNNKLKKVGLIFDKTSKSRYSEIKEFRKALSKHKLDYSIKLLTSKKELKPITKELISENVDAIILTSSDKLYDNIGQILELTTKYKIPIFSVNRRAVQNGAIAALASDYYKLVDESLIPMAIKILKDKGFTKTYPIKSIKEPSIYINLKQSKKLNIKIPDVIINQSVKIEE